MDVSKKTHPLPASETVHPPDLNSQMTAAPFTSYTGRVRGWVVLPPSGQCREPGCTTVGPEQALLSRFGVEWKDNGPGQVLV